MDWSDACCYPPMEGTEMTEEESQQQQQQQLQEREEQGHSSPCTAIAPRLGRAVVRSESVFCGRPEMENTLRIMTHAGRILWRAAVEAIPGGNSAFHLSIGLLAKLLQKSRGRKAGGDNDPPTPFLPTAGAAATTPVCSEPPTASDAGDVPMEDVAEIACGGGVDDDEPTAPGGGFFRRQTKRKPFVSLGTPVVPSVSDSEDDRDRPCKRARRGRCD